MSGNGHRLIAREGVLILVALLVLAIAVYVFLGLIFSLFIVLLFVFSVVLFRDPKCEVPSAPLGILSPASGRILSVTNIEDYWLSRRAIRIRIKISPWDTHCLRCPTEGKVMNQWSSNEAKQEFNRQYAYWIQTDEGDDLLLALGMNSVLNFARMTLTSGQRAGQGQRCGFLYFAGIIDVYLPDNSRLAVAPGEQISSGTDIIGQFVHGVGASAVNAK